MPIIKSVHLQTVENRDTLPSTLVLLMAASAGLGVASLYYSQPMLGILGQDIHASDFMVGWIPTLTQLGYAFGILLLVPLGDIYDRRKIVLIKVGLLCLALSLSGFAPGVSWLLGASLIVGLTATLAQDIVPAAATLAPESQRGKTVGTVMTGLLLGILLSRVFSGFVAEHFGWRLVFGFAAICMALTGVAVWRGLPHFKPATRLKYRTLLGSMIQLWRNYPILRKAALAQGLLSIGFSAFWSTLGVMLHEAPFHLGSAFAGTLGLAGAAGALAAPLAGRMADRRGPELVTCVSAGLVTVSFATMWLAPFLPSHAQLALIVLSALGFDFGIQASLVAHQTIVYGIDPASHSRLNSLLFTGMFLGMASGAAFGSFALGHWGWPGVVTLATVSSAVAFAVRMKNTSN